MRRELIDTAKTLADPEYQRRAWVDGILPDGVDDDGLDYAVHFIFDDTVLGDDAQDAIGAYLENAKEAQAVTELVRALEALLSRQGLERNDAEYLASDDWPRVVDAARGLCDALGVEPKVGA